METKEDKTRLDISPKGRNSIGQVFQKNMKKKQLVPKEIIKKLPKLGETSEQDNPLAVVKFFYPDFSWTWYGIEFDGEDIFYGYVKGFDNEFGTFSLKELLDTRGKLGCEIERDLYFKPRPVSEV